MKSYLYETHLHTAEGSRCGKLSAVEQIRHAKAIGLTGVCITDHFLNGNTTVSRDLPWAEQVAGLAKGYELAREEGEVLGVDVLFGWEYAFHGNDFLTYGLDPAWLLAHPEVMALSLPEYCNFVREAGAIVIHAHPYREAHYIDMIRLLPRHVDGVEIDNACRTDLENNMARIYAESYGLPPSAGSDNHVGVQHRYAVVGSDVRFADAGALARAIVARQVELLSLPGEL